MTRDRRVHTVVLLLGLLLGSRLPVAAQSPGPAWATVVDADTRAPLRGVMVLRVWFLSGCGEPCPTTGPAPERAYHFHGEAISDESGRIMFPAHPVAPRRQDGRVEVGPRLYLFKAGYGGWWYEGLEADLETLEGLVIAMVPLKTREAREAYLEGRGEARVRGVHMPRGPQPPDDIPASALFYFERAVNAERAELGLPPVRFGR